MEKQNLPNAVAVLVLGILSILTCCCYGFVGLILAVIALLLAKKDMKMYQENPSGYINYSTMNAGRILAIIGFVINLIIAIAYVYYLIAYTQEEKLEHIQRLQEWSLEMQQNQQ